MLKLSISDVIVSQKSSNGDGKLHFFVLDYNFTDSLCAKYNPLFEKGTKQNQNKPMETTEIQLVPYAMII